MIEKIPAPQAIPFDGKIQALGNIGAAASITETTSQATLGTTAQENPAEPATGTPETIVLPPDTLLTREAFEDGQRRWKAGETMRSENTPLAGIALSDEEWRLLDGCGGNFNHGIIYYGALSGENERDEENWERNGLSREQAAIIYKVYKAFEAIVNADGERGGLGAICKEETQISIGYFDPFDDPLGWHTDLTYDDQVRYVVAFGEGMGTRLATGNVRHEDLNNGGHHMDDVTNGPRYTATQAQPGIATRFVSNYGLHSPPTGSSYRLFMTASIVPNPRDGHI